MNLTPIEHIKNMLKMPAQNLNANNEQTTNNGVVNLLVIANITRKTMYQYATIGSTGNIMMHSLVPFNFIDDNQQNPQYRKKTVWVSVNQDPQQNPNDPTLYFNNNFGNLLTLMKPKIEGKDTAFNELRLMNTRIKEALIPTDLDNINLAIINKPAIDLKANIQANINAGLEGKERTEQNILAYKVYEAETLKLVEDGLLTNAFVLINPVRDTVSFGMGLDESMRSGSHPCMNYAKMLGQGLPISKVPTVNRYRTTVQIIETDDLSFIHSDNNDMLGKRTIKEFEGGRNREAITKLAIIKDYNNDTPILISIVDPLNPPKEDNRSRVEAFEALLDKGINTFTMEGSLSPIVRLKDSNAARHGNIFFELRVENYSVFASNNMRNTMEADSFNEFGFSETEGDEQVAETFIAQPEEQEVDLTTDLIKQPAKNQKSKSDLI